MCLGLLKILCVYIVLPAGHLIIRLSFVRARAGDIVLPLSRSPTTGHSSSPPPLFQLHGGIKHTHTRKHIGRETEGPILPGAVSAELDIRTLGVRARELFPWARASERKIVARLVAEPDVTPKMHCSRARLAVIHLVLPCVYVYVYIQLRTCILHVHTRGLVHARTRASGGMYRLTP